MEPSKPCLKLPASGLGAAGSQGVKPVTLLTHVNVTLRDLHRLQTSVLDKVPAGHLGDEQFKRD